MANIDNVTAVFEYIKNTLDDEDLMELSGLLAIYCKYLPRTDTQRAEYQRLLDILMEGRG